MGIFSKGVAVNAIALIVIVVLVTFFALILYYKWYDTTNLSLSKTNCILKRADYCLEWAKNSYDPSNPPFDWDTKSPGGCDKVNVFKPLSAKDCTGVGS